MFVIDQYKHVYERPVSGSKLLKSSPLCFVFELLFQSVMMDIVSGDGYRCRWKMGGSHQVFPTSS